MTEEPETELDVDDTGLDDSDDGEEEPEVEPEPLDPSAELAVGRLTIYEIWFTRTLFGQTRKENVAARDMQGALSTAEKLWPARSIRMIEGVMAVNVDPDLLVPIDDEDGGNDGDGDSSSG